MGRIAGDCFLREGFEILVDSCSSPLGDAVRLLRDWRVACWAGIDADEDEDW